MRYQLNLLGDHSYSARKSFEGQANRVEDESGSWGFSSDRVFLVLRSSRGEWSYFRMPESGLLGVVDARGDYIGARAVTLKRSDSFDATAGPVPSNASTTSIPVTMSLSGGEWKLTELRGKPVRPVTKDRREIRLSFDTEAKTFSGVSGCNDLVGAIESGWRTLTITPESMRICRVDQYAERALRTAFKDTRAYRITGTTLELFDEQGATIARLDGRSKN